MNLKKIACVVALGTCTYPGVGLAGSLFGRLTGRSAQKERAVSKVSVDRAQTLNAKVLFKGSGWESKEAFNSLSALVRTDGRFPAAAVEALGPEELDTIAKASVAKSHSHEERIWKANMEIDEIVRAEHAFTAFEAKSPKVKVLQAEIARANKAIQLQAKNQVDLVAYARNGAVQRAAK